MANARTAIVLSAGLGTRLRPLTYELAKPMVPVGDAPVLAHVAARVRLAKPRRLVVNVHHRPDDVALYAEAHGMAVSREAALLGTAGGIAHARDLLGDGDVLIWNGDILSDLDPDLLVEAHVRGASSATLAVRARPRGDGNVGFSEDGRVTRLREESFGEEAHGGDFMGIHVLGEDLREALPERGCLVGDVYLPALRRGVRLAAHVVDASFLDVGSLATYAEANRAWLRKRGLSRFVAETASVAATVTITDSIVGAGARVDADLHGAVVWPGAHVHASMRVRDAVVTAHAGVVPVG